MAKWIIEQKNGKLFGLLTKDVRPRHLKGALSRLAWKILIELARKPAYPKKLARELNIHEQKVYYHIRNMQKAGLIKIVKEENVHGVTAKYYGADKPSFTILLKEMESVDRPLFKCGSQKSEKFLEPFIFNNKLNALVVLGSPEPHGPHGARAKDVIEGINLGLFLGKFLNKIPADVVKFDTEITEDDMKNNLIVVGGPGVNKIFSILNNRLPIRFKSYQKHHYSAIYSHISKKIYPDEECGLIVKTKNPLDESKKILLIAGRRAPGTRSAMLSFLNNFDDVCGGNKYNSKINAKVVRGIDSDSDGIIDKAEIME
ncbi:MAG: S-layer protein [Candidatus Aenigmarchaeota archaeon]|nr:S-layer protein [Candidatus Aenigmarchaeota archaeon]